MCSHLHHNADHPSGRVGEGLEDISHPEDEERVDDHLLAKIRIVYHGADARKANSDEYICDAASREEQVNNKERN